MNKRITLGRTKTGFRLHLLSVENGKRVPIAFELTDSEAMTVVHWFLREWKAHKIPLPPKLRPFARPRGVERRKEEQP